MPEILAFSVPPLSSPAIAGRVVGWLEVLSRGSPGYHTPQVYETISGPGKLKGASRRTKLMILYMTSPPASERLALAKLPRESFLLCSTDRAKRDRDKEIFGRIRVVELDFSCSSRNFSFI